MTQTIDLTLVADIGGTNTRVALASGPTLQPGSIRRYRNAEAEGDLPLGAGWRVRLEDSLLDSLREWLPAEAVEVRYR